MWTGLRTCARWSGAVAALALSACGAEHDELPDPPRCPALDQSAAPNVEGVFDYASRVWPVYGTIAFEQAGHQVRVTDTSYANANDRALDGEGVLDGNRLEIMLTPKNGDTDYQAQVDFVFSEDGGVFCLLGFADTNGDEGGPGSHYGQRR